MDSGVEIFSLFIDNLPKDTQKIWIYNLFSRFRKIRDLYIPNKTSKITGQQFGFVRFGNRNEAIKAAEEINGSWVWGHKLVVNLARFQRQKQHQSNWQLQRNAILKWGAFEKSSHTHGREKGNGRRNVDWEEGKRRNHKLKQRQDMSKGNRIDWDKGNWRNQEMKQRQGVGMGNRSNGGNQNPKKVWIWRKKNVTRPQSNNLNRLPPNQIHHDRKAIWAKKIMSIKAKEVVMNGFTEVP
ncbi:hypothetical protein RHMOL_Rhmol10G0292300 [Rhododendron molle]|uniref:Uncharacterized protein n=1 Tax=Rhododendron molle TaxID=49168 RepID=A0ACC0M801_RHOML|nr:hypothetical protein RHMOL_Rhmol10G0292300 [Rhododendron molle]